MQIMLLLSHDVHFVAYVSNRSVTQCDHFIALQRAVAQRSRNKYVIP